MVLGEAVTVLASGDRPPGLLPAREQMAVSLGFHIILSCFGVAFPAMIFVMHRRGIVATDPIALRLAKRWAKVSAGFVSARRGAGAECPLGMGACWARFVWRV